MLTWVLAPPSIKVKLVTHFMADPSGRYMIRCGPWGAQGTLCSTHCRWRATLCSTHWAQARQERAARRCKSYAVWLQACGRRRSCCMTPAEPCSHPRACPSGSPCFSCYTGKNREQWEAPQGSGSAATQLPAAAAGMLALQQLAAAAAERAA